MSTSQGVANQATPASRGACACTNRPSGGWIRNKERTVIEAVAILSNCDRIESSELGAVDKPIAPEQCLRSHCSTSLYA